MKYAAMILLISVLAISCKKDKQKENTDNDIEVTVIANRSSDSTTVANSETIHLRLK
jgi:hypothetical protein